MSIAVVTIAASTLNTAVPLQSCYAESLKETLPTNTSSATLPP